MAELDGFEQMMSALAWKAAKVRNVTPEALTRSAHLLEGAIKVELSRTSHRRGTPTPSPPGSPPSLVTGTLRRSIQVEGAQPTGPTQWTAKVDSDLVYAAIQERGGTAGHAQLPARPYFAPAFAASLPAMGALIEQAWSGALE